MAERDERGRFTKGGGASPERMAEVRAQRDDVGKLVDDLITEAGLDPKTVEATLRLLARKAVKGTATDRRAWLQQTGQLKKSTADDWDGTGTCPTCGLDSTGGLVLSSDTLDELADRQAILKGLLDAEGNEDELRDGPRDTAGGDRRVLLDSVVQPEDSRNPSVGGVQQGEGGEEIQDV